LARARTAGTRWTRKFARRRLSSFTGPRVAAARGTVLIPGRRPSPRDHDPRGWEETPARRCGFCVDAGDTPGARRPELQGPALEETPPELAFLSVPRQDSNLRHPLWEFDQRGLTSLGRLAGEVVTDRSQLLPSALDVRCGCQADRGTMFTTRKSYPSCLKPGASHWRSTRCPGDSVWNPSIWMWE
jgi:hypothetical protein